MKNERCIGTISRGVRAPIIREGDNLANIVVDSVLQAANEGFVIEDHDVVCVTEAVVARAQGNYATVDQIAKDVKSKYGDETIGVIFPILSRNRFSILLKGIAKGTKKIVLMLSYPSDEVGNHLVSLDELDSKGINPYSDVLTEAQFREYFGIKTHEFTGVDYIEYYHNLIEAEGCEVEIILANDARKILDYTKHVLCCDIHTRERSKRLLKQAGANTVYGLDELLNHSVDGSGYNGEYGLLGSNKATENSVKLFPRESMEFVYEVQNLLQQRTGKYVEVMVYGDGAFKDPRGKIWELADPIVSPAFTRGLEGQPHEIKIKYLADNDFANLQGQELKDAISKYIQSKNESTDSNASLGTTPRRISDLIGSLADLTSGSGDKGTPIVYIQGYFDNYTIE